MNVCDTSSYGDTLMCQIWYANVEQIKIMQIMDLSRKHYKFDIEVNVQGGMMIMNVCETLSYGVTLKCKI